MVCYEHGFLGFTDGVIGQFYPLNGYLGADSELVMAFIQGGGGRGRNDNDNAAAAVIQVHR